jgi:hypothetical protein
MRPLPILLSLVSLPVLAAGLLNDTGVSTCFDGSSPVTCTAANSGDSAPYPGQDARFGRDAAQKAGTLPPKTGGGAAGFDFTPLDASGKTIAFRGFPPVPSATPACTRDNITGLIWEVKTAANANDFVNWTEANDYATLSNIFGRCGAHSGWRVPTLRELLSIVHRGTGSPAIDTHYFPNTASNAFWTSDRYARDPMGAWRVNFANGSASANDLSSYGHVRLVRSGTVIWNF